MANFWTSPVAMTGGEHEGWDALVRERAEAERRGWDKAVKALRDENRWMRWLLTHDEDFISRQCVTRHAADYLESLASAPPEETPTPEAGT